METLIHFIQLSGRVWIFEFVPQGFFSHLIARCMQNAQFEEKQIWKNVILFFVFNLRVLIKMTASTTDALHLQVSQFC